MKAKNVDSWLNLMGLRGGKQINWRGELVKYIEIETKSINDPGKLRVKNLLKNAIRNAIFELTD